MIKENDYYYLKYYKYMIMIETQQMTKRIKVKITNIEKAKDKNFITYIYESLLNNLLQDNPAVSHVYCLREPNECNLEYTLKVGRQGDFTWCLMRENLYLIAETEPDVAITIIDIEEEGTGVVFTMGRLK